MLKIIPMCKAGGFSRRSIFHLRKEQNAFGGIRGMALGKNLDVYGKVSICIWTVKEWRKKYLALI